MSSGAYSMQYTVLQQQDETLQRDKEKLDQNMFRSRCMHVETTKRRKALAVKRKQDAEREERRRQEILAKRREHIKAATEKYQRLNKNYTPKTDEDYQSKYPEIKAQLESNLLHTGTPALEDALRAVRGSSHYRAGSAGSRTSSTGASPYNAATSAQQQRQGATPNNRYLQGAHTYHQHAHNFQSPSPHQEELASKQNAASHSVRPTSGVRPGQRSASYQELSTLQHELHSNSLRNVTNSRTLFEQQLENQQNQIAEQQKDLLQQFTSALHQELSSHQTNSVSQQNNGCHNSAQNNGHYTSGFHNTQQQHSNMQHANGQYNNGFNTSMQYSTAPQSNTSCSLDSLEGAPIGDKGNTDSHVVPLSQQYPQYPNSTVPSNSHTMPHHGDIGKPPSGYSGATSGTGVGFPHHHRTTNSPIAVVTPSVIRRSGSDSSIAAQAQQAAQNRGLAGTVNATRPYNKDNYDTNVTGAHASVASSAFTQDSLEIKPSALNYPNQNGAAKSGHYLDSFMNTTAPVSSGTVMGTQQREVVVNAVGLESLPNKFVPRASSVKAWAAPNNDDLKEFAKLGTSQGNILTASAKPLNNRPDSSSAFVHGTISSAVVPQTNKPVDPGVYSMAHSASPQTNAVTPGVFSEQPRNNQYNNSQNTNQPASHYGPNGVYPKPSDVYKLGANYHGQIAGQEIGVLNVSTYDVNQDTLNRNIVSGSTAQPVQQNGFNNSSSGRYIASVHSTPTSAYNASAYSQPLSVAGNNYQTMEKNCNSGTSIVQNAYPQNGEQIGTNGNSSYKTSQNYQSTTNGKAVQTTTGSNAAANAHVRITIPEANSRAIPRPSAAIRIPQEDPSKIPRPTNPAMNVRQPGEADVHQIPPSPASSSDVEEESHPIEEPAPVVEKRVKGILKKPVSATYPRKPEVFGVRGNSSATTTRNVQRSMSAHANINGIRDSVDLAREQLSDRSQNSKIPRKKSVRFWDEKHVEVREEVADDSGSDVTPVVPSQPPARSASGSHRPPRPVSAKLGSTASYGSTAATDIVPTTRTAARAMSAGAQCRGPFLRPHPPSDPPTGRATMSNRHHPPTTANRTAETGHHGNVASVSTHSGYTPPATSTYSSHSYAERSGAGDISAQDMDKSIDAVYDANGLRLDRTPTDDEINWLWDKVRSCLDRKNDNDTTPNGAKPHQTHSVPKGQYTSDAPNQYNNNHAKSGASNNNQSHATHSHVPNTQSGAALNTKYIDGNTIAPQYRTQLRIRPSSGYGPANGVPRPVSGPVKKVSMDTLMNLNRRQGLLNRKTHEQGTINYHQAEAASTVQTSVQDLANQRPVPSEHLPAGATGATQNNATYPNHVSESLAAFMTAEQIVGGGKPVTLSQVEAAVLDAQARQAQVNAGANARNSAKVPSALSMEEQRLIQSLERLNERLKVNETGMLNSPVVQVLEPKPPVFQYGGFKGRQPIAANQGTKRFVSANGTVPRHHYRVSSAGPIPPNPGGFPHNQRFH